MGYITPLAPWIVLNLPPSILWFYLVRGYNRQTGSAHPAILYALFYWIPWVHYVTSWSFISDLRDYQISVHVANPLPRRLTFLSRLALPYFLLTTDKFFSTLLGVFAALLRLNALAEVVIRGATVASYIALGWLILGFRSLISTVSSLPRTRVPIGDPSESSNEANKTRYRSPH